MKDHKNNPRENAASLKQVWWFPFFRGTYWLCQSVLLSHSLGSPSGSNPSEDPVWSRWSNGSGLHQPPLEAQASRHRHHWRHVRSLGGNWPESDQAEAYNQLTQQDGSLTLPAIAWIMLSTNGHFGSLGLFESWPNHVKRFEFDKGL